ncbi:general substrate transporter [Aureobasidium pullulans]|uniref:General substrate transporter n=1 Tax=Aureobasidium pullulans TaxID=5580 RepID=A0A4T0DLU8_AURPU|nr:general substrate transporter [Aureobasidium pullulans]
MFSFRSNFFSNLLSGGYGSALKLDLPPVESIDIEETPEKRARTLKHLIKANHINHSIIYHHLEFHNHSPHILGSAYFLGANVDQLLDLYEKESKNLEPWQDSPSEISRHDWRDYLGKREYQRAWIDFLEDQLVQFGYDWRELLDDFLYSGKQPLINNLIAGRMSPFDPCTIVGNATKNRQDSGSYRIPIAVQFAWALILFGGLCVLPETPRFYIKKNKHEQAARSLSRLRRLPVDHPSVEAELAEITANHEYEMSLGKASYIDCFKGNLGKRLATGCGLQALQQLTGVNFIFYYGTPFFQNSGIGNGFTISLITSCINVASTFPGLYLVEKWGRRKLLLFGAFGMAICQLIVAGVGLLPTDNQPAQKALVAFVCIYIFFFASTWGPCAWVVTGELFTLKVRAKSLSMTTASNWLLNWAIAYSTPYMVNAIHTNVFWIWAGFCCLCTVFVYTMIYETKGLSLEQVDELYGKVSQAWKSEGFVPTVSFQEVQDVTGGASRNQSLADIEANAMRKKSVTHQESIMAEKL